MPIPKQVLDLINTFARNIDAYKTGRYNETQLRREFIDPFFTALGWDVDNTVGYAQAYKDVIHEDAIKIGAALKAPDYCFRIGGTRKFFIEAKKPSIDIKGDPHPAFQLRRYAWSAKLPLSILTDFEEFAVYDCRIRPKKTDRASTARIKYIKYTEYPGRWDEIESIFSRDAILKGSFDKYAQSTKRKKGTAQVDAAFLAEIERWREILARNIALRNPDLTNRQLNFAVQKTIDRVIFLRIAEDRGLERYGELLGLCNGRDVYDRLLGLFRKADDRYNSGLFHFQREKDRPEGPDELTPALTIDDAVLKDIFKTLYYPDSPYEFSVLPAEILGHVYEQFLGKVITLTAAHRAKIEEKPQVKKAGGVYYTPAYIVDYIVENTVGKLLASRTVKHFKTRPPRMDPPLTICDPACGSGSFLLGAYQHLLDWHLNYYTKNNPDQWLKTKNPPITQTTTPRHLDRRDAEQSGASRSGETCSNSIAKGDSDSIPKAQSYKLTVAERKRILLDHIYGVDIDPQAVEVTKLSLLLKVLEGEKSQTLFATQRALPDLANNIKCGNSLIAPDFYQNQQMLMFDEEQTLKINAFDWKTEFPQIFNTKNPGFDTVIGNPPYGAALTPDEVSYVSAHYDLFASLRDVYVAFIQQAHTLLASQGRFGYIIPSAWLGGPRYLPLRKYFLTHTIASIIQLPFDVFSDAYIDTLIITTCKLPPTPEHTVLAYDYPKRERIISINPQTLSTSHLEQSQWCTVDDCKFVLNPAMLQLVSCLFKHKSSKFSDVIEIKRGVLFAKDMLTPDKTSDISHPYFQGDIYRYQTNFIAPSWVEYGPKMREYPKEFKWFEGPRLLLRRLVNRRQRLMASFTPETVITNKNLYTVLSIPPIRHECVLGILNSKLISRLYLAMVSQSTKDDFPQVTIRDIRNLPFPTFNLSNPTDKSRHDKMVSLVQTMLDLNKVLQTAKTPDEKTALQRQITATDNQIDQLVYELYDLTEEEIKIVEAATR